MRNLGPAAVVSRSRAFFCRFRLVLKCKMGAVGPGGARGAPAAFRPQGGEPEARTQGRLRLPRAAGTPGPAAPMPGAYRG